MFLIFSLILLLIGMPLAFAESTTSQMVINESEEEEEEEEVEEEETKSTSSKGGGGRTGKSPSTFSDNSHSSNEKSTSKQSFSKAPSWTRNMLASWADSTDNVHVGFFAAMSLLENNDVIDRPFSSVKSVPSWVKGPTDWWSEGLISDEEFVSIIQYCYDEKVIVG